MLWLLGSICVLLGLLVYMAMRIDDRLLKMLDTTGAMLLQLDLIVDETRSTRSLLALMREEPETINARDRKLRHLEHVPDILRHLMALRELTHGRRDTEHDKLGEWPSVSPREERIKAYGKRRPRSPETAAKESDQAGPDASASPP